MGGPSGTTVSVHRRKFLLNGCPVEGTTPPVTDPGGLSVGVHLLGRDCVEFLTHRMDLSERPGHGRRPSDLRILITL